MFAIIALVAGMAVLMVVAPTWAQSPSAPPPPGASACTGCHASAGVDTPVPSLLGRDPNEIATQVAAFRSGQQPSTVMDRIAKGFSEMEMRAIADWYAQQKP